MLKQVEGKYGVQETRNESRRRMPSFVIDSVIFHELIHLLVTDHSPAFYELMQRYPEHEIAKAYLDGYSHAQQHFAAD
jgi:predicted metal-dependent hydrolase